MNIFYSNESIYVGNDYNENDDEEILQEDDDRTRETVGAPEKKIVGVVHDYPNCF
jgi:hypothetical protein